jgi:hypothetical protein
MKVACNLFILVCLLPITVFASNLPLPVDSSTRFGYLGVDGSNYDAGEPYQDNTLTKIPVTWYSDTVTLDEGDVFRVLTKDGSLQFKTPQGKWYSVYELGNGAYADIVGPTEIRLKRGYNHTVYDDRNNAEDLWVNINGYWVFVVKEFCQYAVFKTEATSTTVSSTEGGEIVLPSGLKGNVNLTLERSTDLENWVEVPLGSYNADESDAYFRIRAKHTMPDAN